MSGLYQVIKNNINNCLAETNIKIGKKHSGKVRDVYEFDSFLAIITTDRQSAFDKILGKIPFKGKVLNLTSNWWFEKTKHIINNHLISNPLPNLVMAKKCSVIPIEFIVRQYITGTSKTSIWTHYKNGAREYCGYKLPNNIKKNEKLPNIIITPTTKSDHGDSLTSKQEILEQNTISEKDYNYISDISQKLFEFGAKIADEQGLILVDTKYEFGRDENGNIILIDEIHTPDSSRYWVKDSYISRIENNEEPEQLDKEILRRYYASNFDINNDELPEPPKDLVIKLASSYIKFYEKLTNSKLDLEVYSKNYHELLEQAIYEYYKNQAAA